MKAFRLNALRATNDKAPGVGITEGLCLNQAAAWGNEMELVCRSFSHSLNCRSTGAVPMSSNHPQVRAAAALRARLVAIAAACASAGVPLPVRAELARICGVRLRQIHRHIPALRDIGALATVRRAGRLYVQEARS